MSGAQLYGGDYLFGRQCSLVVSNNSGDGLEFGLSNFAIEFAVSHAIVNETPSVANIRIYNLSSQTSNLLRNEFTNVVLRAGYQSNFGIIFQGSTDHAEHAGNISFARAGRQSPTDTFIDLTATDGQQAYNYGLINVSLAAGHVPNDVSQQIALAMGLQTDGLPSSVPQTKSPRGRVLYGMARDHARRLARTYNLDWKASGGKLIWLARSDVAPGNAIVLNSRTGLVGIPNQTIDGINIRSLLNPSIGYGSVIKVNNADINKAPPDPSFTALNLAAPTDADGYYKVLWVDHIGETRGNDWYSDMTCIALKSNYTPSSIKSVVPGVGTPPGAIIDGSPTGNDLQTGTTD